MGNPFQGNRFTSIVQVDVTDLRAIEGRSGVCVVPGTKPLDLSGRILGFGRNMP